MDEHSELLNQLYSLQKVGIKLGLERTNRLFRKLNNPEKGLKFIHIAGTNGKGSVCSIIAKALENAGFKVGFYSSPHLVSLRERFRINGKAISWKELSSLITDIWPTVKTMIENRDYVTFFEATVAIAVKYFKNTKCDFVLWETGMGGRLDSTNIVSPVITAITSIGLDHEQFLGETVEKIASEKAGIIKKNVPVFVGKMDPESLSVIKRTAETKKAQLFSIKGTEIDFSRHLDKENLISGWNFKIKNKKHVYFLPLSGAIQPLNLKLSYIMLKYLSEKYSFSLHVALKGIEKLRWPGRIQLLPDGKILDGAHNPQGIDEFVQTVKSCCPQSKFTIIFGCMKERNPANALKILSEISERFIFVPINTIRPFYPPENILKICSETVPTIPAEKVASSSDALKLAEDIGSKTVIVGSFYLAGEILQQYYTLDKIIDI
ncbi:MAG: bifunctional folylpolyglutamate synthase/dihydrofolate synthase [Victivallales bacterium]|nr:bifunctional folylpolyglutamate synthase/dihydrofolate synthase [Victivallales bacterium]